jgi:hypothetical protein
VQHGIRGWVVKGEIQDACGNVHNNAEDIGPALLETCVPVECSGQQVGKGYRGRENKSAEWAAQLIGDELADDDGERKLSGGCYSVDGVGFDELELKLTGGHKARQVGRHTILTL